MTHLLVCAFISFCYTVFALEGGHGEDTESILYSVTIDIRTPELRLYVVLVTSMYDSQVIDTISGQSMGLTADGGEGSSKTSAHNIEPQARKVSLKLA